MTTAEIQFVAKHELHREMFVLRVLVFCSVIYLFLQVGSMFRLFGVPGIPPLLLLSYRTLDFLVVASFFLTCGTRLQARWEDALFVVFMTYPVLIGLARGNLSITFFNDIAIFSMFLLKVMVIRTLVIRIMEKADFDEVFRYYAWKIIVRSVIAALMLLALAMLALRSGANFYYQAPAELTFAAALAIAQGYMPSYLLLLALAAVGGKRAILIGVLVIGAFGVVSRKNIIRFVVVAALVSLLAIVASALAEGGLISEDAAFVRRLNYTWISLQYAAEQSRNWEEFFMFLDPSRFVEYVSVRPHLDGWAFWWGNGYGFRYRLDDSFLQEFGRVEAVGDVTNAHFTPLAIMVKFGAVGLVLWVIQVVGILARRRDPRSYFQFACKLGFLSMVVQTMFSFVFFISFFTPIYVAGSTLSRARQIRTTS